MKDYLKKKNQLKYQKFLVYMKIYYYFKNMAEENLSQEFRLKNIDETRNYLIEEINPNKLISKNHKKACTTLNYIEHFLILVSITTGCVSISSFASLIGIPIGITSSVEKKMHNEIILIAKCKLNSIEVLIPKTFINSVVSHDEFVIINNVVKEYAKMKEKIKNLKA